ncbi:hypothetical protein IPN35_05730 [Candidatus Peregrinibacteria bacterium]|nr:MAG: hypothetical protein IPN35_05730 [Candidatus Peregrinibacteria bacterium]
MPDINKIALLREMLEIAEKQIRSAKRIISDISGEGIGDDDDFIQSRTKNLSSPQVEEGNVRVVEGAFDGQNMIDSTGRSYPVPANYASKSKLVVGDHMKLTITEDGKFLYKQIGPIERRSVVGPLTYENGQYKVLADGKAYKVLLASVTFYRADIGDEVTILLPENQEAEWGAMDAVIPKAESD